ncbi:hypothetical protein PACTADRAFT_32461 [Pachysolen tannophilus NRRL Y-2460]|uniref:Ubiquitin-like domain-containing protein n=1 Tax=Pachysolen tannophilus NRRL Y-2460 TaxID=669874 RepID=A0A1E4TYX3_PACTA|nr:hypothetical protein PACTADRAFT_32461 [Pachysolen tannophilus NRRL Y-2460]
MSSTLVSSEDEFSQNLINLLNLTVPIPKYNDDYSRDLKQVSSLGITLAKIPNLNNFQFQKNSNEISNNNQERQIEVFFKSIKPPLKFTHKLNCTGSSTIYKLKEDLINNLDLLKLNSISISCLKFLIKGKVINDNVFLKDLINFTNDEKKIPEISFMVIVGNNSTVSSRDTTPIPMNLEDPPIISLQQEPNTSNINNLSEELWAKIGNQVASMYNTKDTSKIMERLKKGWNSIQN